MLLFSSRRDFWDNHVPVAGFPTARDFKLRNTQAGDPPTTPVTDPIDGLVNQGRVRILMLIHGFANAPIGQPASHQPS